MNYIPPGPCRFTPTCVGNTVGYAWTNGALTGSPPRVWGILMKSNPGLPQGRFTPTCVGNTDEI